MVSNSHVLCMRFGKPSVSCKTHTLMAHRAVSSHQLTLCSTSIALSRTSGVPSSTPQLCFENHSKSISTLPHHRGWSKRACKVTNGIDCRQGRQKPVQKEACKHRADGPLSTKSFFLGCLRFGNLLDLLWWIQLLLDLRNVRPSVCKRWVVSVERFVEPRLVRVLV